MQIEKFFFFAEATGASAGLALGMATLIVVNQYTLWNLCREKVKNGCRLERHFQRRHLATEHARHELHHV